MKNEIVQKEDKVLRKIAKEIPVSKIKTPEIKKIIDRMIAAVNSQEDGVAIAAPQIGENLRIFVISKKLFEILEEEKREKEDKKNKNNKKEDQTKSENKKEIKDMIFINPEILKTSKKKVPMEEGCLSVRWLYGKVPRSEKTLIRAYDENGKQFTIGGSGLLSQAFQHETDHLEGILFTDKATDLKDLPPEKI